MYKFHKESNEAHNAETNSCGNRNFLKFCKQEIKFSKIHNISIFISPNVEWKLHEMKYPRSNVQHKVEKSLNINTITMMVSCSILPFSVNHL